MSLAIFDLDNTLIGGDSDHLWGEFLLDKQLVDAESFKDTNDRFYENYKAGTLDVRAYLEFALAPLKNHSLNRLDDLHSQFMSERISPIWLPKAVKLIERHREADDTLLIITATNRFVTAPIARKLGIDHLLASEAEIIDGRYTGKTYDTPCFQEGKIARLKQWLEDRPESMDNSVFYSDSFNDLPLLKLVDRPVAVDPDDTLRDFAQHNAWPIISLREEQHHQ